MGKAIGLERGDYGRGESQDWEEGAESKGQSVLANLFGER